MWKPRFVNVGQHFYDPPVLLEPKKKRTPTSTTREKMSIKKSHGIVAMETRTIRHLLEKNVGPLRRSQSQHRGLEPVTDIDLVDVAHGIEETLEKATAYLNNSRQWMHLTLELLIATEVKFKREAGSGYESLVLLALLRQT